MYKKINFIIRRSTVVLALCSLQLLIPANAAAQKCHYDKSDKDDAFSTESRRAVTSKIGPDKIDGKKNYMVGWTCTIEETGGRYYVGFEIILFGKYSELFAEGGKLLLKLDDNKIVELTSDKDVVPVYMTALAIYTHYTLKFAVDAETLKSLSKAYVTDIKFTTGSQSILAKISDKCSDRIQSAANCILHKD